MNYKFVIAHYNEDLEWIKPYAKNTYIYHKGNDTEPPFDCYHWEKLPNVGREGHTYLYHIVKNYHQLSDINIFLQGSIADHQEQGYCSKNIEDYLKLETKSFFSHRLFMFKRVERLVHGATCSVDQTWLKSAGVEYAKLSLPEYVEKYAGTKLPMFFLGFYGACFSIKSHLIQERDIEFYKNLIQSLEINSNPEEGHYLEMLWVYFFNINYKILSKNRISYLVMKHITKEVIKAITLYSYIPFIRKTYLYFKRFRIKLKK